MTAVNGADALPLDEAPTILYLGQHESERADQVTSDYLAKAQNLGYDLLTAPITTEAFQSRVLSVLEEHVDKLSASSFPDSTPLPLISPLTPKDSTLTPDDFNSSIVGFTSSWIDIGSRDPLIAHISRQVFNLEVAYAAFCGISNVVITGPMSAAGALRYARAVLEALSAGPYLQLHILMPVFGELEQDISASGMHLSELARPQYAEVLDEDENEDESETEAREGDYNSWAIWNLIRTICGYSNKLSIALELPRQLGPLGVQSRWYSEPVRLVLLPRTTFTRNAKGYPVLSKQHQQYLTRFLRLRFPPWVLLSDVGPIMADNEEFQAQPGADPTPAEAASASTQQDLQDRTAHLKYLRHLQQMQPPRPPMERFGQGYQDYLQSPLQPLTDNLESITYEVFEKDPVKYEWYKRAVALALKDLRGKFGDNRKIVVAVVGAGRGPLVTKVLQASRETGIDVQAIAVEKNPNAHVLLQRRNATDPLWNNSVTVIKSDMRTWLGPKLSSGEVDKVDILVSELLGSFADNELSPECLDGVQHVLHPEHGVNIPQSYSAHLTPIAAPRLHSELLSRATPDLNMTVAEKWELPYVVMLHQHDFLSMLAATAEDPQTPDVKEAWSFSHPAPQAILDQARQRSGGTSDAGGSLGGDGTNKHNNRTCSARYKCADGGVCHGIAGYFETVLYASTSSGHKVELSTNPVTMEDKSKDMISWFPIFFPLKTPLYVPDGADVEITMWRQTDDRKVWYEWIVEVFEGKGMKQRRLGASDLHSSRKNGCLM